MTPVNKVVERRKSTMSSLISKTVFNLEPITKNEFGLHDIEHTELHYLTSFVIKALNLEKEYSKDIIRDLSKREGKLITFNSNCIIYEHFININNFKDAYRDMNSEQDKRMIEFAIKEYMRVSHITDEDWQDVRNRLIASLTPDYVFSFKIINLCGTEHCFYTLESW